MKRFLRAGFARVLCLILVTDDVECKFQCVADLDRAVQGLGGFDVSRSN
jgi:hypothetical protein